MPVVQERPWSEAFQERADDFIDQGKIMGTNQHELPITEIVHRYPDQWVLVEETAWDSRGHPVSGIVRAASVQRDDLRAPLQALHQRSQVKTFIFYTGEQIPADLTVVL